MLWLTGSRHRELVGQHDVRVEPSELRPDDTRPVLRRVVRIVVWPAGIAVLLLGYMGHYAG